METPDKIKRGLECCNELMDCRECPYREINLCSRERERDTLTYILQLEQANDHKDESIRQLEQRVPRWISVEERLPDKSHDWVLIIGKWESDGGWIVPHVAEYREGIWMTNGTGWNKIEDLHIKITHWMPLPELPEEDA